MWHSERESIGLLAAHAAVFHFLWKNVWHRSAVALGFSYFRQEISVWKLGVFSSRYISTTDRYFAPSPTLQASIQGELQGSLSTEQPPEHN